MPINKKNLESVLSETGTTRHRGMAWPVYENYEIDSRRRDLPNGEVEESIWLVAPKPEYRRVSVGEDKEGNPVHAVRPWESDGGVKKLYPPLRRPDLLLRLREIGKKGCTVETMRAWARDFGLLGVSDDEGRVESLTEFTIAASRVARVLGLWEAATYNDASRARELLEGYGILGDRFEDLKKSALIQVGDDVADYLRNRTYPRSYLEFNRETGEFVGVEQGWGFRNLLGAVYLQMMWLMKSGGRRCKREGCPKTIDFEVPEYAGPAEVPRTNPKTGQPYERGPYRTRSDKEFCSPACKRNWRYHNVEKPLKGSG